MLQELTDDDVLEGDDDEDEQATSSREAAQASGRIALQGLVEDLLKNSLLELLVANLGRLNESEEAERAGVFHSLGTRVYALAVVSWLTLLDAGLIENLISANPPTAALVVSTTTIVQWLLARIQLKGGADQFQNRQYASEILAILVQTESGNRTAVVKAGGVDALLGTLSVRSLVS